MAAIRALTRRTDFDRVTRQGRRSRFDGISVTVLERGDAEAARLGLAVGTVVGSAVVRNRLRRRLKEAFVASAPPAGLDVVLKATPEAVRLSYEELLAGLQTAVRPRP